MDTFPIPAPPFSGDSRRVAADAAFDWLRQGWALFVANPAVWVAIGVVFMVIMLGLSIVPLIGRLAAGLLLPIFVAGLLFACRRGDSGETPELGDLFAGFAHNSSALVRLGVLCMLGVLAIGTVVLVLAGGSLAGALVIGRPTAFGFSFGGLMLAALLWLALSVPLLMAIWFAPALVAFKDMAPLAALKASFAASLKNTLVFVVFGLITLVLVFFAALPAGIGFLVLTPVLAGALYASYRDVFVGA